MEEITTSFASEPALLLSLILGLAGIVALTSIIALITSATVKNAKAQEQTRREIAAYVAEGTLSAEDAERILEPHPWWAGTFCVRKAKADQA